MLKKDALFVWIEEGKGAIQQIKSTITKASILRNLSFSKEFILYAYGSDTSIATILTQKYQKNEEYLIAFFKPNYE